MSTTKSLIRTAREALDRSDYATALRLCETGLEGEEDNYMLLVFKALCLKNLERKEEAAASYRSACRAQPEQTLAWQGLASLYEEWAMISEKPSVQYTFAVEPLERLCSLCKAETEKVINFTLRLMKAYEAAGRLESCLPLFTYLASEGAQKYHNIPRKELLDRRIAMEERLESEKVIKEVKVRRYRLGADPLPILKERVASELVSKSTLEEIMLDRLRQEDDTDLVEKIVQRLMRKMPMVSCSERSKLMNKLLSVAKDYQDACPLAKKVILDFTDWDNLFDVDDCASEQISDFNDNTSMFLTLKRTTQLWRQKDYKETLKFLKKALDLVKFMQANYGIELSKVKCQLDRLEGLLYAADGRFADAIPILKDCHKTDKEATMAMIACYEGLRNHLEAISLYQELVSTNTDDTDARLLSDLGWQYYLAGDHDEALKYLHQAAASTTGQLYSLLDCRLGIVYWHSEETNRQDKKICFKYFIDACKADPSNYAPFLYLGKYYQEVEIDRMRAEKCFIKALSLNVECIEAALALSFIWLSQASDPQGDSTSSFESYQRVIRVLEPVAEEKARCSKLWMYLGIAYGGVIEYTEACSAYHNALKGDKPDQTICLLGLGETYHKLGKLMAATKAYERLLEAERMSPESAIAARIGLATVQLDMKQYASARSLFKTITGGNAQVMKFVRLESMRAGYLLVCHLINIGCVGAAFETITDIVENELDMGEMLCAWKLLAELSLLVWRMAKTPEVEQNANLFDPIILKIEAEFKDNEVWNHIKGILDSSASQPLLIASVTLSCLCHLKMIMESDDRLVIASSWSDLATGLMHLVHGANQQSSLLYTIIDFADEAVKEVPAVSSWLVKGVAHLHLGQFGLAQHCFIKSLPSKEGWLNLALLYYRVGELELARAALQRIQIDHTENDCSLGWLYDSLLNKMEGVEYRDKVVQAAALCNTHYNDHIHALAIVVGGHTHGMAEGSQLQSAKYRLAFNSTDRLAKALVSICKSNPKPRSEQIVSLGRSIIESRSDADLLRTMLFQLDELSVSADSIWLRALIYFLLGQPLKSISVTLDHIAQIGLSLASVTTWNDLLYWYRRLSEAEIKAEATSLIRDWMRLEIAPEIALKIHKATAAETIKELWHPIPADIGKTLDTAIAFSDDFNSRSLLT